ncbi:MAG: HdeD family acid-resistance protein [Candidatus Avoscillospira sp.]
MDRRFSHLKGIKWTYLLFSALWLLAGVVLLIWPRFSSEVICIALGVLCMLYGIVKLFGYFSRDPYRLAFQFDLALGILCLVLGIVLIFFSRAILSLLPVIVGIYAVVGGVFKLQTAFEAKRFGMRKWWGMLVLSLLTMALGVVLLVWPFSGAMLAIRFMGLAMIMSGVEDLTATAYTVKTKPNGTVIDVDDFWEV